MQVVCFQWKCGETRCFTPVFPLPTIAYLISITLPYQNNELLVKHLIITFTT